MAHVIEAAKSGRAKCRKCREKIEKDTLRFGHEVPNDFDASEATYQWYHLACAAEKLPLFLAEAMQDFAEEIPDRDALETLIQKNRKKQKPSTYPYAELAPSGRSTCQVCGEKIAKGEPRVAVEREIEAGGFPRSGAGYLHPQCCQQYEELPDELVPQLRANSISLDPQELDEILQAITG